jgi:hypothetical protein
MDTKDTKETKVEVQGEPVQMVEQTLASEQYPKEVLAEMALMMEKELKEKEQEAKRLKEKEAAQLKAKQKKELRMAALAAWAKAFSKLKPGDLILKQVKKGAWMMTTIGQIDFEEDGKEAVVRFEGEPLEQTYRVVAYDTLDDIGDVRFVPVLDSVASTARVLRNISGALIVEENSNPNKKRKLDDVNKE